MSNISYQVGSWQSSVGYHVRLSIHDMTGKEIRTLVNESKWQGEYIVHLDASDLHTGIYFVRLQAGVQCLIEKIVVIN